MWLRTVAGDALGRELQPEELLLRHGNAKHELSWREEITAAETALVQNVFGLELVVVIVAHPRRAEAATHLLVGNGHQDDVAVERDLLALEHDERVELRHARALHVERTAPPDLAVRNLAAERIARPSRGVCRHDVHVVQEHERLRRTAALEPRHDDRAARSGFEAFERNALSLEDAGQKVGGLGDVTGRDRRIDSNVALERLQCFRVDALPIRRLGGERRLKSEGGEKDDGKSHRCSCEGRFFDESAHGTGACRCGAMRPSVACGAFEPSLPGQRQEGRASRARGRASTGRGPTSIRSKSAMGNSGSGESGSKPMKRAKLTLGRTRSRLPIAAPEKTKVASTLSIEAPGTGPSNALKTEITPVDQDLRSGGRMSDPPP